MDTQTQDDDLQAAALDGAQGEFWIDGGPHIPGAMHYRDGELRIFTESVARAHRSWRIDKEENGSRAMSLSLDPPDGVADFAAIPLLGTLDDGRTVTVVDARLTTDPPPPQGFWGTRVLLGAHATTVATTFTKARVALPQPELWRGVLTATETREVRLSERVGALRVVMDNGVGWLELTLGDGLVDREWERRFWGRVVTLLRLWTHAELREECVQLWPGADGGWADLLHAGPKRSATTNPWASLLPPDVLSLDTVAHALTLFDELAPVPDVASKHMTEHASAELAVLANSAALEGLHRRDERAPFPAVEDPKPIAEVAARAASAALAEQGLLAQEDVPAAATRMTSAFSLFNQPSFAERLRELLPPVEGVAPGLIGPRRGKWVRAVTDARHMEAHRFFRKPKQRDEYRQRVDSYIPLAISTEWVLRIALLLRLGVAPELLHTRLLDHQQFEYALANMDHDEDPPRLAARGVPRQPGSRTQMLAVVVAVVIARRSCSGRR